MERRRYLALLSVGFAGCNSLTGGGGETPTVEEPATGTGTATTRTPGSTTAPPTATETVTDTPTRQPTETTERPTETATDTPTPAPDFDDHVAAARDALEGAYDAYLGQVERGSELRRVDCDVDFSGLPVRQKLAGARAALDRAANSDPSYQEERLLEQLRDVRTGLDRFAVAQEAATRGCTSTQRAFAAIYTEEDVDKARRRLRNTSEAADAIDTALSPLTGRSDVNGADFDSVSFMDAREFREKRNDLQRLAEGFDSELPDRTSPLRSGFRHFVDGVDAYDDEHYAAASSYLDDAVEQFETARTNWDDVDGSSTFDSRVDEFTRALRKLSRGTEKLSEAATEFSSESGATEQLQAKQRYRENANVESMPTVQRVLNF